MSTTYLSLVNSTIVESGADAATFAVDGSDFTSNTNSLMNRFKGWVSRAWRDIQQEAYDWDFMSEQAVVNIDPGFMFYAQSPTTIKSVIQFNPTGTVFNILDQTGNVAIPNLQVNYIQDLTGVYTSSGSTTASDYPFGALTLLLPNPNTNPPLNIAFKSGAEYFISNSVNSVVLAPNWPANGKPVNKQDITSAVAVFFVSYPSGSSSQITYDIIANSPDYTVDANTGNITLPLNAALSNILFPPIAGVNVLLSSVSIKASFFYYYTNQLAGISTLGSHGIQLTGITGTNWSTATGFSIDANVSQDGKFPSGSIFDMASLKTNGLVTLTSLDNLRSVSYTIVAGAQMVPVPPITEWDFTVTNGSQSAPGVLFNDGEVIVLSYAASLFGVGGTITNSTTPNKCYVHSWKSFDFEHGENQDGDFVENVQEIDQTSFRMTDYYSGNPLSEVPLTFVPWEIFRTQYDLTGAYPGLPRVVTKDNVGRWRFYPHPYYRVTVSFDYSRKPQIITNWNDTIKGLNDDFVEVIMWKALVYFGEYDEQPSVASRATKNYKTMLGRLELKNREKFHFQPHRMW